MLTWWLVTSGREWVRWEALARRAVHCLWPPTPGRHLPVTWQESATWQRRMAIAACTCGEVFWNEPKFRALMREPYPEIDEKIGDAITNRHFDSCEHYRAERLAEHRP